MREFLEKNYTDEAIETDDLTIKLVIKALLEVRLHLNLVFGLGKTDSTAREWAAGVQAAGREASKALVVTLGP